MKYLFSPGTYLWVSISFSIVITTPIRKQDTIFADPYFTTFWFLFNFWICGPFEIIISKNDTIHINQPDDNKVLMIRDYKKLLQLLTIRNMAPYLLLLLRRFPEGTGETHENSGPGF
jgi:hypothetical protein